MRTGRLRLPAQDVPSTMTGTEASLNSTRYSRNDTRPSISHVAQAMLAKFGALVRGGSGPVRLVRV